MKQANIILLALVAVFLGGCGSKVEKELTVDEIFKEELKIAYEISTDIPEISFIDDLTDKNAIYDLIKYVNE